MRTVDGGSHWIPQQCSSYTYLISVYFVNADTGWAVGGNGMQASFLKTTDGGLNWSEQEWDNIPYLRSVYFVTSEKGWAVGDYGSIFITIDGGVSWSRQQSGTSMSLKSVCFLDSNKGWAVGNNIGSNIILRTIDGGKNWDSTSVLSYGSLESVCFVDENIGWVGGYTHLFKTNNGGLSWKQQISSADVYFTSLCFYDANLGWAVGQNRIVKTIDGGQTWIRYPHLTVQSSLLSVKFVNSTTGWAVGMYGAIFKTNDGGGPPSILERYHNQNTAIINGIADFKAEPNPFNPSTKISYILSNPADVIIKIFSVKGDKVATLINAKQEAGSHTIIFNAQDLPSGLYISKLVAGTKVYTKKITLIK
jgi:photosystem II stability/assembly factor-like uncharacterized protein